MDAVICVCSVQEADGWYGDMRSLATGRAHGYLRCAPPSLISFPFPYSISFFPLHLSSLSLPFFPLLLPPFAASHAHPVRNLPSPAPSVCRFFVPSSSQLAMPPSHARTLLCSHFRPFTACSRVPRHISAAPYRLPTASAAYRLISCPTPAFHLHTAAPSPLPLRVPFPCPICLTTCNAPITRTHAFL